MNTLEQLSNLSPMELVVLGTLVFWAMAWKGFALWIAAREGSKYWFVFILIVNLIGVFEMFYIFFVSQTGKNIIAKYKFKKDTKETPIEEVVEESQEEKVY